MIDAKYSATFMKENSAWSVSPPQGTIGASQTVELCIMVEARISESISFISMNMNASSIF